MAMTLSGLGKAEGKKTLKTGIPFNFRCIKSEVCLGLPGKDVTCGKLSREPGAPVFV